MYDNPKILEAHRRDMPYFNKDAFLLFTELKIKILITRIVKQSLLNNSYPKNVMSKNFSVLEEDCN